MKYIENYPDKYITGGKRANLNECDDIPGWFVGSGKTEGCQFEGGWWDMICFARNVLASENTKMVAPEFYKPEWKNDNYLGE